MVVAPRHHGGVSVGMGNYDPPDVGTPTGRANSIYGNLASVALPALSSSRPGSRPGSRAGSRTALRQAAGVSSIPSPLSGGAVGSGAMLGCAPAVSRSVLSAPQPIATTTATGGADVLASRSLRRRSVSTPSISVPSSPAGSAVGAASRRHGMPPSPASSCGSAAGGVGAGGVAATVAAAAAAAHGQGSQESQAEYYKPEQTIIFYDWDDTLCPSDWIRKKQGLSRGIKSDGREEEYLRELQEHLVPLLKLSMQMGKVIIVTNAMAPWVEMSCQKYLPALAPLLGSIPVVYARNFANQCRDPFNNSYGDVQATTPISKSASAGRLAPIGMVPTPTKVGSCAAARKRQLNPCFSPYALSPQHWKEQAFEHELSNFYSKYAGQSWKNIVCIGDAPFEHDAVRQVVSRRPTIKKKCRTKSIKFFEEPDIKELISQIKLLHEIFGAMVHCDKQINLRLEERHLENSLPLFESIMDR